MTTWASNHPKECQLCCIKIRTEFVDGKVAHNKKWAVMCVACHKVYGVGFGVGKGQLYKKEGKEFVKKR